mmetsp:Transcript_6672/g.16183  ORF Transcript_6672/g.16183 Transcript_6672/m.16183 type:complete len:178 (-) Transcript_6672:146-679(-)
MTTSNSSSAALVAALFLLFAAASAGPLPGPDADVPSAPDVGTEAAIANLEEFFKSLPPTMEAPSEDIVHEGQMMKALNSGDAAEIAATKGVKLETEERARCPFNVEQCCWIYETDWFNERVTHQYYQMCCFNFCSNNLVGHWFGGANISERYPYFKPESFCVAVCHLPTQTFQVGKI